MAPNCRCSQVEAAGFPRGKREPVACSRRAFARQVGPAANRIQSRIFGVAGEYRRTHRPPVASFQILGIPGHNLRGTKVAPCRCLCPSSVIGLHSYVYTVLARPTTGTVDSTSECRVELKPLRKKQCRCNLRLNRTRTRSVAAPLLSSIVHWLLKCIADRSHPKPGTVTNPRCLLKETRVSA